MFKKAHQHSPAFVAKTTTISLYVTRPLLWLVFYKP